MTTLQTLMSDPRFAQMFGDKLAATGSNPKVAEFLQKRLPGMAAPVATTPAAAPAPTAPAATVAPSSSTPSPIAFPMPPSPLPPNTPGPQVNYPGGIQNFWSNNGRTFNIPAGAALAQRATPAPEPEPKTSGKGLTEILSQMQGAGGKYKGYAVPSWFPADPNPSATAAVKPK